MENNQKRTVLIVDDENFMLQVLTVILSPEYRVLAARNGRDALAVADKEMPDIILLDIVMPEMNGYMVFDALKSSEKTRNIPVIFITGVSEENKTHLTSGAAGYIVKPFQHENVRQSVRQLFMPRGTEGES